MTYEHAARVGVLTLLVAVGAAGHGDLRTAVAQTASGPEAERPVPPSLRERPCAPQPPPPTGGRCRCPPSACPWPNEPDGFVTLNDQPWDELIGNGWDYLRRTASKDSDIVKGGGAAFSPPNRLRIIFTPDMRRDTEPGVHWIRLPEVKEIYTAWFMKLSCNWTGSPAGAGKITFLWGAPAGHGWLAYSNVGGSSAPHWINLNVHWAPYDGSFWQPNVNTTHILYDRWHRVEWYVKWESRPRAGDGIMRWWVDGVLNGDYTNVHFPSDGVGFEQFEFAPTRQNPPPEEQYMYIDHTRISVR